MIVPNWRRVVAISLSFWMQIAGLGVLIWPELKYAWTGEDSDPIFFWWLGVLLLVAGILGRLYEQGTSKLREWARIAGVAVILFLLAVNRRGMLTPYRRPIFTPCRRSALGLPGAGRVCRG